MGHSPKHNATDGGDERIYMMRAIALAERAMGYTSPNPMVGCILVKDGRIVGEGFHVGPGKPHAELAAIRAAGAEASGATAYVTLEPCNHHGRTPPCAEALLKADVRDVVYAVADPNPLAQGGGETLRAAGIPTRTGLCEAEARHLARFWLHQFDHDRPYIIGKFAASLDGRTATHSGDSKWITSDAARIRGHDLRHMCDAILVGIETILTDDPTLTARPDRRAGRNEASHPLRIILDSKGRLPLDAKICRATTPGKTLLATTKAISSMKAGQLQKRGIEVLTLPANTNGYVHIPALLKALKQKDILSVMVEGGGTLLGSFVDEGLLDEVWAFIAPILIGGGKPAINGTGPTLLSDAFRLENIKTETLGPDILMRGTVVKAKNIASQKVGRACLQV